MNNDIQIARFIASGNMSREDALHESESLSMSQPTTRQEDQKNTAEKLKQKLKSRRKNLAKRTKEANKLRKQNPTLGDKLTKYKPTYSKMSRIGKDEGSLTATGKFVGNVAKAGLNVGKAAVGGVAAARRMGDRIKGAKDRDRAALKVKAAQRMVNRAEAESIKSKTDSKPNKFAPPKASEKKSLPASKSQKALPQAKPKPFGKDPDGSPSIGGLARSNKSIRRRLIKQRMVRKEEFIQEVKDKKEDKIDKIIDIMKGKNVIKVNPDVKEGTVIVKDAKGNDFVEIVDIISPSDVRSDWKKELGEGSLHKWFKGSKSKDGKGGWVNVVTGGTCASDEPGEGTPKCVSSSKRASMTKAERLSAARRKKKADPNQQSKSGAAKPTYVATDKKEEVEVDECWKTHKKVGMKMKGGKLVNDCRPKTASDYKKEEVIPEAKVDTGKSDAAKTNERNQRTFGNRRNSKGGMTHTDDTEARRYNTVKGRGVKMKGKKDKTPVNYHKRDSDKRVDALLKSMKEAVYTGPNKDDRKLIKKMDDPSYAKKLADYEKNMDPKKRQALKDKATKGMKFTHEEVVSEEDKKGKGSGKKDACYHKVKASASVWPSAYASGRLVQCRKKGAANYGNSKKESYSWRDDFDYVEEGAAWTKKAGKNPEGGLNEKGRKSYERENPGSNLKAPQPEGGSRKKSFCARMGGMKKKLTSSKTANDPNSRINKALRKWKC